MKNKHEFKVYIRSSCHLCDDMVQVLSDYLKSHLVPYNLEIIDIAENAELEQKFGQFVPVLQESGTEICHYYFDANRWHEYFS